MHRKFNGPTRIKIETRILFLAQNTSELGGLRFARCDHDAQDPDFEEVVPRKTTLKTFQFLPLLQLA